MCLLFVVATSVALISWFCDDTVSRYMILIFLHNLFPFNTHIKLCNVLFASFSIEMMLWFDH